MLMLLRVLRSSLQLTLVLLAVDGGVAYVLTILHYTLVESLGDLMLAEVAVLFILAGVLDFASSIGVAQFRKTFLGSKQGYSSSKHKASHQSASVLLITGLILLAILIVATVYDHA
jgi:hypothetical protein